MPLPKPKKTEDQTMFIPRCVKELSEKKEFSNTLERIDVCGEQFKKHGKILRRIITKQV